MDNILDFKSLPGFHYSDKTGIVNVYSKDGKMPTRRQIFQLLAKAYKQHKES